MGVDRRQMLAAGAVGGLVLLSGCGLLDRSPDPVAEIESAPRVLGASLSIGPGGGLGYRIDGKIAFDVSGDELFAAFDEAWRLGAEAIRDRFDENYQPEIGAVTAFTVDARMGLHDLLGIEQDASMSMTDFYERYGIS
ncbi:MAG TPA: hypothetical protein H9837_09090 [Candidatus Brachybacterium merdigallinarum]|jgi:hypothetical protein|nr:hypothetical protein [Candidatus Brachybacterium merdigallinarum]